MSLRLAARVSALALLSGLLSACYDAAPTPSYAYVPCGPEAAGAPPPPPAEAPPPPGAPAPLSAAATPADNDCVVQTGYAYPAYPYDSYYYPHYPPVVVGVGIGFRGHSH